MENNLRKIIREMIMAEAYEHTDDEIVTFENIDLAYEFNKINKLLFDGKLEMVPLNWSTSKGRHGHVSFRRWHDGTVQHINGLFMSKFFKIPYKMFKDTLAHEMIHVKNLQDDMKAKRRVTKGHGYDFIREMNRINSMGLGFKITIRGEEKFDVADDIKGRNVYFVILKLDGEKSGDFIAVMIPKAFTERKTTIERIFNNLIKTRKYRSVTLEYYQSDSPKLLKYPVQRTFARSISYTPIKPGELEPIKELGTFIEKVELGKNNAEDSTSESKPKNFLQLHTPTKAPEETSQTPNKSIEQNKKILAMFKSSNDKFQKDALFNILKTNDPNMRERLIDAYNQRFGKLGFI